MLFNIPVFNTCCYFFPRRLGLLIFGYSKLIYTIILDSIFINLLLYKAYKAKVYLGGCAISAVIVDSIAVVVFIIGFHKNHLSSIKWYYTYSCILFILKCVILLAILIIEPILAWVQIPGKILYVYMLLLIRSEIMDMEKKQEPPCEFVNKLASPPQCNINIEVVDDSTPVKIVPNTYGIN